MSAWRNEMIRDQRMQHPGKCMWDSNTITPGTTFMAILDEELDQYCRKMSNHNNIRYVSNNSCTFGEGEQKIFDYIKSHKNSNEDRIDVVYGLDADLIMLSLIEEKKVFLVREAPAFGLKCLKIRQDQGKNTHPLLVLDIPSLKELIVDEIIYNIAFEKDDISKQKLIIDYVLLCSLVGNDFLPPLSFLKIKSNGIEILTNAYKKHCVSSQIFLISQDKQAINFSVLGNILEDLATIEDKMIAESSEVYYNTRVYKESNNIESMLDNYPILNKYPKVINAGKRGWRLQWYHNLFKSHTPDTINAACHKYIEGLRWLLAYYLTGDANHAWYYPYTYSPTILDLYGFVSNMHVTKGQIDVELLSQSLSLHHTHRFFKESMNPTLQLLMVLPPQSKYLVEAKYQKMFDDPSLGLCHIYPHTFDITTYLKTYLWECSAILPDIDYTTLVRKYSKCFSQSI
jgi:5'-3' exoribonuclease 2